MGYIFIVSGPSAVGKTTVVEELLKRSSNIHRIVTCTSREKRAGEQDGRDYYFFPKEVFVKKIENNEFIEYSEVYGNYYGVLLDTLRKNIEQYQSSILVINGEGFIKIRKAIINNIIGIFINPPSFQELERRIRTRNSESEEIIQKRLKAIKKDMDYSKYYNFIIENHRVSETVNKLNNIIATKLLG